MAKIVKESKPIGKAAKEQRSFRGNQRLSKAAAASFPPAISLLRRLASKTPGIDPPSLQTFLTNMKSEELRSFLVDNTHGFGGKNNDCGISYHSDLFACVLNNNVGAVVLELWSNLNLVYAPSYVIHPIVSLISEVLHSLQVCCNENSNSEGNSDSAFRSLSSDNRGGYMGLRGLTRNLPAINSIFGGARHTGIEGGNDEEFLPNAPAPPPFEPNEETVRLMMEMGFEREHALDAVENTESNTLEIAMEYALAHPPPSPASIARRREAREARQRQQASAANADIPPPAESNNGEDPPTNPSVSAASSNPEESIEPMDVETSNETSRQLNIDSNDTKIQNSEGSDLSENEKKLIRKKNACSQAQTFVKDCLKSIQDRLMETAINVIEGPKEATTASILVEKKYFDGNDEAAVITVVICSFLLELCERYYVERSVIVTEVLTRMKTHLNVDVKGSSCAVINNKGHKFSSLCHASVLFLRALPRTRPLVLKNNFVSYLSQSVKGLASKLRHRHNHDLFKWPRWLSPTLLILDVMAQPMAMLLDKGDEISDNENVTIESNDASSSRRGEYARVCAEHRKQRMVLTKTSKRISMTLSCKGGRSNNKLKGKESEVDTTVNEQKVEDRKLGLTANQENKRTEEKIVDSKTDQVDPQKQLSNIPTFMPLITQDIAELLLSICLQFLRSQLKWLGRDDSCKKKTNFLPPTVTHGILLLLTRILRSQKCALHCLKLGGAELLVSIQAKSRFQGHVRLIIVSLRRMLEDESTLQAAMETEIRSIVAKLQKKQSRGSDSQRSKIETRAFVQASTLLICRDPVVFLKAAATSIRIESPSSDVSNGQMHIMPLSSEERTKNSRALGDYFRTNSAPLTHAHSSVPVAKHPPKNTMHNVNLSQKCGRQQHKAKLTQMTKQSKSKSPHRHAFLRKVHNTKKTQKSKQEKTIILNGSPSNHITTLLLNELLKSAHSERKKSPSETKLPFLCVVEYLEIISDLVLAIPVCAAAIHRYHPSGKDSMPSHEMDCLIHALPGCLAPPKNIVSYLLHKLLPQPRSCFLNDEDKFDLDSEANNRKRDDKSLKKMEAYMKIKVSQSTARLLVVLVARAGEGRRRVISDLALALSGQSGQQLSNDFECEHDSHQMWALQVWGELCIGLAAPRSSGVNQDSNSALSFEVVKVMMESGMAHSLMHGINRIQLHHPLAASASAALLRPLEVFTRPNVVDTLHEMSKKEDVKAKGTGNGDIGKGTRPMKKIERTSLSASQQSESTFADDAMIEDGFDADTAERNARIHARRIGYEQMVDEMSEGDEDGSSFAEAEEGEDFSDDEDEEMVDSENYENDNLMSAHDSQESDESDETESSESAVSSSADSLEDMNESEASQGTTFEEVNGDIYNDEENGGDFNAESNDEDTYQWDEEGNDDFFEGHGEIEEEAAESGDISGGGDIEEGWTRIEPTVGHMIFGRSGNGSRRPRGGFMIEAAEAVLGNILRSGELEMDTIAELEDTLGIRISNRRTSSQQPRIRLRAVAEVPRTSRSRSTNPNNADISSRNYGPIGEFPSVSQQNPPEIGFSSANLISRTSEIYNMECLYGGPPLGTDRVYYGLYHTNSEGNRQDDNQTLSVPSTIDTELFPGGPAASTHTRTPQVLHPLLSGVNLPPFNSLLSTTISPENETGRVRLPTNTVDTSWNVSNRGTSMSWNVNSRGMSLTTFERSTAPGISRHFSNWTDDGQPLGSTAEEFSLAFQHTLGRTMLNDARSSPQFGSASNNSGESNSHSVVEPATATRGTEEVVTNTDEHNTTVSIQNPDISSNESNVSSSTSNERALAGNDSLSNVESNVNSPDSNERAPAGNDTSLNVESNSNSSMSNDRVTTGPNTSSNSNSNSSNSISNDRATMSPQQSDANITDGDHVVSSITAGLSLSNQSEDAINMETASSLLHRDSNVGGTLTNEDASCDNEAEVAGVDHIENTDAETGVVDSLQSANTVECPPGMDPEVFSQLPIEMQQEVLESHQASSQVADQLDSSSNLDPEALAALPEDMRREVIQQEQNERRLREQEQAPADPSNAEEMDTVSFLATLPPDTELREQVLLDLERDPSIDFGSLPPDILAEVQLLRERASTRNRRNNDGGDLGIAGLEARGRSSPSNELNHSSGATGRKRNKAGRMRVDIDRSTAVYLPQDIENKFGPFVTVLSMKAIISLMYLLSPVRPQRLLHKLLQNLCGNGSVRRSIVIAFIALLNDEPKIAREALNLLNKQYIQDDNDDFPPLSLRGTAPDSVETESINSGYFNRRKNMSTAAITASFPISAVGSFNDSSLPPVVAKRLVGTLLYLSKNTTRVPFDLLSNFDGQLPAIDEEEMHNELNLKCVETLLGLLGKPLYTKSSSNLDDLLNMIESVCFPLSLISVDNDNETPVVDSTAKKEWIMVPRVRISQERLKLLCSILRFETCKDASFAKINTIARRLCRVNDNRECILQELASVAQGLGADAIRDLRSLSFRLNNAVKQHHQHLSVSENDCKKPSASNTGNPLMSGTSSSAVTLSTSSSELKLLRVLQSLYTLCGESLDDGNKKKNDNGCVISDELVSLLKSINLDALWEQLSSCLRIVSVLEGVTDLKDANKRTDSNFDYNEESRNGVIDNRKKLQNSVAGLLSRFLPTIEAFFVVNANVAQRTSVNLTDENVDVTETPLIQFVGENKVLLNAILRSNHSLMDKGLRAMVQVPRCRPFLDFDVKRQWFKTQVKRLRQHASRRHGSLRLNIRRQNVFEEAFRQLRLRNGEEMRGRLQITFRNEEGVDAGGLSREFFGILAKEMFNPNYALFTSTEDGCTFQPNPYSSINPDHLSYFRFVGRIVGKAVVDGFLLDAHFTRSLYKHMLGVKPTHHDMQAIDPDYYKNLKMILEYNLDDIGLDLTFSTEAHSFGRSNTVDLIPNGRNVKVTEENKEEYVSLVCQHRMTTAIEKQIKEYLDGFYELVKPELISIFTAKELELLISGMPDIDIHDLKKNTEYQGYKASDKEIGWFWNIMFSLSRSEKAAFLQFVTGSSKVPLAGFSDLQGMRGIQKFSIHKARGSSDSLMSAHTCFNALDLPVYKSEENMKEKLLYAIQEGGGGFLFA